MFIQFLFRSQADGIDREVGEIVDVTADTANELIHRGLAIHSSPGVNVTAAWDDLRMPSQGINPSGTASPPTVDQTTVPGSLLFAHNAENIIAGVAQMPHAWQRATIIKPHVHWAKTTSAAGGVVWELSYALVNNGGTLGAYSNWIAATDVISNSDTAGKMVISTFGEVAMADMLESCMMVWKIRRNVAAGADDYAADARLFEFDIHYQVGKFGTVSEIPS